MHIQYFALGQSQVLYNVPSPEVASLGTYGEIPVSHFTGVPNISIPIYNLEVGNYVLPISINYHLSNVKPHNQGGSLGLGWNLMAGGYITRTVRGRMDEYVGYGYYENHAIMQNITESSFSSYTINNLRAESNAFELSSDEFSFNFCGYSGLFYLNEDGDWTVISDHDIKVEFNPSDDGFIGINTLNTRIPVSQWSLHNTCVRFFNKFTLITPDGAKYEFGGLNATEYSAPYYGRNNCDLIPTTWKLVKITTPDLRTIEFEYNRSSLMCDIRYVPMKKIVSGIATDPSNPFQIGRRGFTGYILFGVDLTTIRSSDKTIKFDYFNDPNYGDRFTSTTALFWNEPNSRRDDPFLAITEEPENQFHVFLNSRPQSGIQMANLLNKNILGRIAIIDSLNCGLRSFYFTYSFNNKRKLSKIVQREGVTPIEYAYMPDGHGIYIVTGIQIPADTSSHAIPCYSFTYNNEYSMPYRYVLTSTDSWGYYHGGEESTGDYPSFSYKTPLLMYTKAETLKDITYPTGGKTIFEYELNNYRKIVMNNHTIQTETMNKTCGGLRVSEITNVDSKDNILEKKKYYYSNEKNNSSSSGICKGIPVNYMHYYAAYNGSSNNAHLEIWSEGGFFPDVTNYNSPDVGYSSVIEEITDSNGLSIGYVKYNYSNYDADIYGNTHLDENYLYSANVSGSGYTIPFTSNSEERGKLLSKEYYKANGDMVRQELYKYERTNDDPFLTASQHEIFFCTNPYYFSSASMGWMSQTHTYRFFLTEKETVDYTETGLPYSTSHSFYRYNEHKLIETDSTLTSHGESLLTQYKYPFDFPQYSWLSNLHVYSPIIQCVKRRGNQSYSEIKKMIPGGNNTSLYLLDELCHAYNSSEEISDIKVIRYYQYGIPIEYESKGVRHVLLWDKSRQNVVAHFENCTYAQLFAALSCDPLYYVENHPDADFSNISLPETQIHRFRYNKYGVLIYKKEPNIPATYFEYDGLGRLTETYYYDIITNQKMIINRYGYQYKNTY